MNGVERIVYYAREIEQEASHEVPSDNTDLPTPWPSAGVIEVNDAVVRYRPDLPPVLSGLTMSIRGGEHIGIVGRTGAGKSTGARILTDNCLNVNALKYTSHPSPFPYDGIELRIHHH